MPEPQTFKNHVRFDPPWHFFVLPVLMLDVIFAAAEVVHHWGFHTPLFLWWLLMAIVLFLAVGKARSHSL